MAVQVGRFYKTCATYPAEVNGDSPCKSHALPLTESPPLRTPIRVSEDTSAWHIAFVKLGKPHCCYLVDYDPITSIGIIFLGTLNPVKQHGFVVVHGGTSDPLPRTLRTSPVLYFSRPFYLNFTHPLRVKLVYLPSGVSFQSLKNMPLPNGPPPVGISEYWKVPLPVSLSVSLDPESVETFWSLHKLYRPNKNSLGPSMAGGPGIGGSAAGGGSSISAGGGGSDSSAVGGGSGSLARGAGSGGSAGGARSGEVGPLGKGEMFGINWTEPSVDAPWGKIGEFRVGFDIPIVTEEMNSDSDDEEEPPTMELDELAGVVYITDELDSWMSWQEPYSNGCDGLLVA